LKFGDERDLQPGRPGYQEVFDGVILRLEEESEDEMPMENVHEFVIDNKRSCICATFLLETP
jgi:hypothetical protein